MSNCFNGCILNNKNIPNLYQVAGTPVWICPNSSCLTPYNTQEIESMLLDYVQRRTMGYILQDLTCPKCREVK